MSGHDRLIERLAALVGIGERYADAFGNAVETTEDTRRALLAGFGLSVDTEAGAVASLARVVALREGSVPPLVPVETGRPALVPFRGVADAVTWRLAEESGATREGRVRPEASGGGAVLRLPALPRGYHRLAVEVGGDRRSEATLIAAPRQCWLPESLREGEAGGRRLWGATAQVYGLRSERNLGIGDYTDVADAAAGVGAHGASFLGLSPVHALFAADRTKISPYSPSSRLFLETIHLDPTAVEGFAESGAAALLDEAVLRERLGALRGAALLDHAAVWEAKRPLLETLWERFRTHGRPGAFEAFRRERGNALEKHARFEALSEHFREQGRWWLGDWPPEFRDVHGSAVEAFARENPERVAFHAWLQWLADEQLARAAERARSAGMEIGLYRDLAVGADRGWSEIWSAPERYAAAFSVGAPPDPLGPAGQDWGLPPFDPLALERPRGLSAFRDLVVANMRHAGAIRIDHAFQLQRLFLIPKGMPASKGAYVSYPFEALLAGLRLESHRAQCLVIAEDLGTAPEGFSDAIMASGVLSYRVLWFERGAGGGHGGGSGFKRPKDYPRRALAVFTTHDLPTFTGWWRALDVELRQALGLYDAETAGRERENRAKDRAEFAAALFEEGLLPSPEPPEAPPLEAMTRYLGRTESALVALQFEDALGEPTQANLPGPEVGHPNWRRRLSATVEEITASGGELAKLGAALAEEGRGPRPGPKGSLAAPPPRATYRLQLHEGFTFDDAARIVPYLARLGISHLYASPIHTARPGSTHGYDIVDHARLNPELGGEEGFARLSDALEEHGLKLLLDIVPNHMGVGGADNGWWLSALEWGELSPLSRAFDIDWERLGAHGKLVVPFLGDRYGEALEKGNLKLAFDADEGNFSVWHYEHRFPVCPLSYPVVLDRALVAVGEIGTEAAANALAASERLRSMGEETAPERRAGFPAEAEEIKRRIAGAVAASPGLRTAIERAVTLVNGRPGLPESFGTLHRILEQQSYRLAHWRVAASDINYRRFFDINDLAGLRVEDPEVFARTHELVVRLVREGRVHGLRIDHIDGLADPEGYARALQGTVGPGLYVVVEKILEPGEELRPSWPVAGTSGYDALNELDGLFVEAENGPALERIYRAFSGLEGSYGALLRQAKTEILEISFASELEVLVSDLKRIADADRRTRDYTIYAMRQALSEIVARFPVYRSYVTDEEAEPSAEDRALIEGTVERAKRASALPDRSVHDFAAAALLGRVETEGPGRPAPDHVRRFRRRFQQLTGPVMAKSLEDTLFYRYARLLSLNEVGGDPGHFGLSVEAFHEASGARARRWPHALVATATHDTKRGEDSRARLHALSEMPDAWGEALDVWREVARPHLARTEDGEVAPDANDQIILFQALLGAWPPEFLDEDDAGALEAFRERMAGFLTKALREAKRHSSWVNVDEAYEGAAQGLLAALLQPGSAFGERFRPLARRIAHLGMLNGLSRTALKCTLPGVPDIYQGTEFWDFSLVDPDNRRPVDYAARKAALEERDRRDAAALLATRRDGRVKQDLIARLLADRATRPALYADGDYRPLAVEGPRAKHLVAFERASGAERLLVAVPRLLAGLVPGEEGLPLGGEAWGDTRVAGASPGRWKNLITGETVDGAEGALAAAELFARAPIAVLKMQG